MFKAIFNIFLCVILIFFVIPYTFNFFLGQEGQKYNQNDITRQNYVSEDESDTKPVIDEIETEKNNSRATIVPEDYIKCVVAAEMPVSFELEALKAQSVAARTYAVRHYDGVNPKNLYQAYISIDGMKNNWGKDFNKNYQKICLAVDSTRGETIKYNNEVIEAVFHSTSAGVTESSENVWKNSLPYLKSVDSHLDEQAPNFETQKKIPITEVIKKINNKYGTTLDRKNFFDKFIIGERTNAGYIKNIFVCDKKINAMEIRMLLNLRSTNFTINKSGSDILFTTKGFGHGAGMSQYGANFMAQQGYNYKQILKHYYTGVEID